MPIKNIIFDLGGVLLNLDHQRTFNAFVQLGAPQVEDFYGYCNTEGLLDSFEVGMVTPVEFRFRLQKHLKIQVTTDQFDTAWNAMLLDIPRARLEFIEKLRTHYQTFLLSNTNEIHLLALTHICQRQGIEELYRNCFYKKYYSCFLGERKPELQAFQKMLLENNLKAEETLFVDDFLPNIFGAKQVGLNTLHLVRESLLFEIPKVIKEIVAN